MITLRELVLIMPEGARRRSKQLAGCLPHLQAAMTEFGIVNYAREAAFLAQIAHESGEFRYMEELWGPTPAQRRYEVRRDLGNTHPGDGYRFRGRGPIQVTGRSNYRRYGHLLGVDLESHPDLAATPEVGFRIAGSFWATHGLNALADQGRFLLITRRINGGTNGLDSRQLYYGRALRALSHDGVPPKPVGHEEDATQVRIVIGGQALVIDDDATPGWIEEGVTWAPLRALCEALSVQIHSIDHGEANLIGKATVTTPADIRGSLGVAPVRAVAEAAGKRIHWDAASQTVSIGP